MSLVNMTSFLLNFSVSVTLFFSTFSKRPRKYRETVRFAGHDQHSSTDLLKRTRAIFFFRARERHRDSLMGCACRMHNDILMLRTGTE
jgi:hypothetical protein